MSGYQDSGFWQLHPEFFRCIGFAIDAVVFGVTEHFCDDYAQIGSENESFIIKYHVLFTAVALELANNSLNNEVFGKNFLPFKLIFERTLDV